LPTFVRLIRGARRGAAPVVMVVAAALIAALAGMPAGIAYEPPEVTSVLDNRVEALQVQETPMEDVLRLLAEQNDLNLIIGPDSMGNVTLRFSGVTLRSALDAILIAKGFQYRLYDNIMLIFAPDSLERRRGLDLQTHLFRLKYADARNIKTTVDTSRVLSPYGYTTIYFRTVNVDAAKAASIKPGLAFIQGEQYSLVEQATGTTMPMQARSDVLIVTDKPHIIEKVAALIAELDVPYKQVAIEVRFVETILDDKDQVGIDWQKLLQVSGSYKGQTTWKMGEELTPFQAESGGMIQLGSLASTRFDALLEMMLERGKSKLLSQPSITTIDHQPATISVGVTTWIEERTGSAATGGEVTITYKERQVPIELIVVPHVQEGNRVLMELRPRVEEITGYQEGAAGLQLPLITSRAADARIEVGDGETGIIGGLMKEKSIVTEKRVWLLGSLPLIGHLFRHQSQTVQRTDLSIFITPHIILPPGERESPQTTSVPPRASETPATQPGKIEPAKKPEPAPVKSSPPPPQASDTAGTIDLHSYFPLGQGNRWGYVWNQPGGDKWESASTVGTQEGDLTLMNEATPTGPHPSEARAAYRWSEQGMLNLYRTTVGGDSTVYDPPRVILPVRMAEGKVYENRYRSVGWDASGQQGEPKEVVQRQRVVGRFTVNSALGKFANCLAVETIWFNADEPSNATRKVVWYAPDVGPVKVEHDIPTGSPTLKGTLSALIYQR